MATLLVVHFSMANPQLENVYVKIANDIFDALSRIRISGEARQVLDVIIRKTYGFNKKEDAISLSQFCLATGMRRGDVIRGAKKLQGMNIISKKANAVANIYRINKDFDTWNPLAKKQRGKGVAKKQISVSKKANNDKQKSYIQKTVSKDTITKDNATNVADVPMNLEEYVKSMESSPHRHIRIIGMYADTKQVKYTTKEQWREFTTRNVRSAKRLSPFTDSQIGNAFAKIEGNMKDKNIKGYITRWTLETIEKYLEEI